MKQFIVLMALLWAAMIPSNPAVANDLPAPLLSQRYFGLVTELAAKFKRPREEVAKIVDYASYAEEAIRRKGMDFPKLPDILAVIWIESSFNPNANHPIGPSIGLMQVNVAVHSTSVDIEENIGYGSNLLAEYRLKAKDPNLALVYYNAGPAGAKRICNKKTRNCRTHYTDKFKKAKGQISELIQAQKA